MSVVKQNLAGIIACLRFVLKLLHIPYTKIQWTCYYKLKSIVELSGTETILKTIITNNCRQEIIQRINICPNWESVLKILIPSYLELKLNGSIQLFKRSGERFHCGKKWGTPFPRVHAPPHHCLSDTAIGSKTIPE